MSDLNSLVFIRSGEAIRIQDVKSDNVNLMEVGVSHAPPPQYEGSYEFTPTEAEQTIAIADLIAKQDIVIHPIPQNYGRIEWNGITLRVI